MAESQSLLVRLLETPQIEKIVPRLQPEVLHRVIQACGLEDSAEFVALATPAQVSRILDADLWRVRRGGEETFDIERFGVWITILVQAGIDVAADKLAGLEFDVVVAGLSKHLIVRDHGTIAAYVTLDGELVAERARKSGLGVDVGGYRIEARRTSAWDDIVELLAFMESERGDFFHRLMRACVRLSSGPREEDGFHALLQDDEQHMADVASDRASRREQQGYVSAVEAQAFLREARGIAPGGERPPLSPLAIAYSRSIEPASESADTVSGDLAVSPIAAAQVASVVAIIRDAGVLPPQPLALLPAGDGSLSQPWLEAHVSVHTASGEELAYLTNAMVAGGRVQERAFTLQEAANAVAATCNLGLENWPQHWSGERDLITAFQVGWSIVHRDVCMWTARQVLTTLCDLPGTDVDTALQLRDLGRALERGLDERRPWKARGELDAILALDAPAWAALMGALDECPVVHGAVSAASRRRHTIDPADFSFISRNEQIATLQAYVIALPSRLAG